MMRTQDFATKAADSECLAFRPGRPSCARKVGAHIVGARTAPRSGAIALAGLAALLLAGCAGRSVTVGAIPDDYRTNHPIIIAEKERTFDIPVASGDRALTISMREIVRGVALDYRASATGTVRIMSPTGSGNAGAASLLVREVAQILKAEGVPGNRIVSSPYHVASYTDAAPIRISFVAMSAQTGECGRWPDDVLGNTSENRSYANFGCASQSNLAAQIANPADLLNPRGMTPIDATRRSTVLEAYRKQGSSGPVESE